jgi:hypothetical protein
MIRWLKFDEWQQHFENNYSEYYCVQKIDFYYYCFTVDLTLAELQKIIPFSPIYNPTEQDEPGPCERWYGCVDELLFWVTYYYTESQNYTLINCVAPLFKGNYRCSFLENLVDLPHPLLTYISWISCDDDASQPVYFQAQNGVSQEIYRAKNNIEATELVNFLQSLNPKYQYFC